MNKKITIAHICTSAQIGGTEKTVSLLLERMNPLEYSHCLIVLKERGPLNDLAERNGIPQISLEIISFYKIFRLIPLFKFIRAHEPDLFMSYLFHSNLLARILGRIFKKKVICGQRNIDSWRKGCHIFLDRWTSRWCDLIISNSMAGKNRLINVEKIPAEKIQVIYNGVDIPLPITEEEKKKIREKYHIPENGFTFLCAASFQKKKGHSLLLSAFKEIINKNPEVLLLLAGEGEEKIKIISFVKENRLEQNIIFTGVVTPLIPLMQTCDAFVLSSLWEGIPNVLLEAMACEKAVIVSNAGGMNEIVENERDGFLSESPSPDSIRDNALKLLKNKSFYRKLSENALNKVRLKWTVGRMINEFQKSISIVLERESL